MDTADKLMNIAINGEPGEEVTVEREDADDVVEETTVTKTVRKKRAQGGDTVIVED